MRPSPFTWSPPRIHDPTRVVFDEPPICVATANFDPHQRKLDYLVVSTGFAEYPVVIARKILRINKTQNGDGAGL
jgi:hypothetical protein